MSPRVSVIIAAYNAEPHVEACIRSVLAQTYAHFEVLVVDDASTDRTAAIVAGLARQDARLRLERRAENSGRPAVPRNQGLRAASGEFVALLDADDLWGPRKLADQVDVMDRLPDLVLTYSILRCIGAHSLLSPEFGIKPWPRSAATTHALLRRGNTIPTSTVLARRAAVVDAGGFNEDPRLSAVEDYDLWLRLSQRAPFGFIPRIHGAYRVHGESITRRTDMAARLAYLFGRYNWQPPAAAADRSAVLRAARNLGHLGAMTRAAAAAGLDRLFKRRAAVVVSPVTS